MEFWFVSLFFLAILSNGLYFLNKIAMQLVELNKHMLDKKVEDKVKEKKAEEEKAVEEKK